MKTLLDTPERLPEINYEAVVDPNSLKELIESGPINNIPRRPSIYLLLTDLVRVETVRLDGVVNQIRLPNTPNTGVLSLTSPGSDIDKVRCVYTTDFTYERGSLSPSRLRTPNIELAMRGNTALLELNDPSHQGIQVTNLIGFSISPLNDRDKTPIHTFQGTAA